MPEDNQQPEIIEGANPVLAIGIAVLMAALMVAAATYSFLHSGAYTTVKQIQIGTRVVRSIDHGDIDTVSPIKAADIDQYASSIKERITVLDDNNDFGSAAVSDSALGLN
ncbi:MAG TPA: hypothetical protein VMR51_03305 [Patescibacteria group bacterium]|nr:hypothetical protein [Patescibacteria group bacterium]